MAKKTIIEPCLIWASFMLDGNEAEHFVDDDPKRGWFPLLIVDGEAEAHPICDAIDEAFKDGGLTTYWNPKSDYEEHRWLRLHSEIKKTARTRPWNNGREWILWKAALLAFELRSTQMEVAARKIASEKPKGGNTSGASRTAARDAELLVEFEKAWTSVVEFAVYKKMKRDTMSKSLQRARDARESVNCSR